MLYEYLNSSSMLKRCFYAYIRIDDARSNFLKERCLKTLETSVLSSCSIRVFLILDCVWIRPTTYQVFFINIECTIELRRTSDNDCICRAQYSNGSSDFIAPKHKKFLLIHGGL